MPNGEFHLLLPLDKAWGGQQSCKLKGTALMNSYRGSLWLFRTASCLGECAFKAPAFKCLVLIRRAWVDLADLVVNWRKSVALLELLSSYHAGMCTKTHCV